MNWNIIEVNWPQHRNLVKARWGKLTNEHLDATRGIRAQLLDQIHISYGITLRDADEEVTVFQSLLSESKPH